MTFDQVDGCCIPISSMLVRKRRALACEWVKHVAKFPGLIFGAGLSRLIMSTAANTILFIV
jgi:hypothetical protein